MELLKNKASSISRFTESFPAISVINQSEMLLFIFNMSGKPKTINYTDLVSKVLFVLENESLSIYDALLKVNAGIKKETFYRYISNVDRETIRILLEKNAWKRRIRGKMYLGKVCGYGHEHENTGKCLRYNSNSMCVICHNQQESKNKHKIDYRIPKEDVIASFPLDSDAHYLGRLCPNNHKYHGHNYSVRFKCNKVCVKCHRVNLHLENTRNKLSGNMAKGINRSLKGGKQGASWEKIVGYSVSDLIDHLTKQFNIWMTWDNYGSFWHVDHIIPISSFCFNSYEDTEFKKCWALSNLQPLEGYVNLAKGNKRHKKYANL